MHSQTCINGAKNRGVALTGADTRFPSYFSRVNEHAVDPQELSLEEYEDIPHPSIAYRERPCKVFGAIIHS